MVKIQELTSELNGIGKMYYNPVDMSVIDQKNPSEEDKKFMLLQDEKDKKYSSYKEQDIRDAYFRGYSNLGAGGREE